MKMTTLILALSFLTATAHAELITQGGFGDDGPTGLSIPLKSSSKDASLIYKSLDVKTDKSDGSKSISLDDGSTLSCQKPTVGISGAIHAGCQILLRDSSSAKVTNLNKETLQGTLKFSGELAAKIYSAMDVKVSATGAKKSGNLICKAASCSILNLIVSQSEMDPKTIIDFK